MSIATTIAALQALHATVDGVTSAPAAYPSSLNTADLPTILTLPGDGTLDLEAIGARKRGDDIFRVFVYVAPAAQGAPVNQGVQEGIAIMDGLRDLYTTADNIVLSNSPSQATLKTSRENPIRHTGIGILKFGELDYRGFTFDVGVMEKW